MDQFRKYARHTEVPSSMPSNLPPRYRIPAADLNSVTKKKRQLLPDAHGPVQTQKARCTGRDSEKSYEGETCSGSRIRSEKEPAANAERTDEGWRRSSE